MKICMFGFSGQNMNLWLKYFRDHTEADVTLFTPRFSPSSAYDFPRLRVFEIAPEHRGSRIYTSLFHHCSRLLSSIHLRSEKFDLVIMHGLYNRSFAPYMFKRIRADVKAVILWNDINHRKLWRDRHEPAARNLIQALRLADVILPTWDSTRDAFLANFPFFTAKTRRMSWGTDMEMLMGFTSDPRASVKPKLDCASVDSAPRLFWPRTIRENIRHDILIEALSLLEGWQFSLESLLVMGKAGDDQWCRKILSQLHAFPGKNLTVHHQRHIPLHELYEYYLESDIMVNLADSDQLSTCIVEAFLFNMDVILSDIAPYRVLKQMGFSVYLVDNNPLDVARVIQKVVKERCTAEARERREHNRKMARAVFDLETNLSSIIRYCLSLKGKKSRNLLFMAPGTPPFGGVADQSQIMMRSQALNRAFKVVPLRTNPLRISEDPTSVRLKSVSQLFALIHKAFSLRTINPPDLIQLVANGDISFIRDMVVALLLKTRFKSPLAVHLHCSRKGFWHRRGFMEHSESDMLPHEQSLAAKLGYQICRLLLKGTDSLTYLTGEIADYYVRIGFPPADSIVPNAVCESLKVFQPGSPGALLYVGRLSKEKGFFDLLESLKLISDLDWTIDVLGDYPSDQQRDLALKILDEHPCRDRISLHGLVSGEKKWQLFKNASLFILPTHIDVLPVVILEAMAFGCAVITTNTGEIPGIDGAEHFTMVEPGDVESLADAARRLLVDRELCLARGRISLEKSETYQLEKTSIIFTENLKRIFGEGCNE